MPIAPVLARAPRWALSFADLCLVLLGFFVMLHAGAVDRAALARGMRTAFGDERTAAPGLARAASELFVPGEAVLTLQSRTWLAGVGRKALARGERVTIASEGFDGQGRRFDRWELAAARTAAVARGVAAGGLPEDRIAVSLPATRVETPAWQSIAILRGR